MVNNTFLGLQPYTEDDAYRFKGRTEESQELFRLIVRNDFTVCYAESGDGKTSLLNAGVFPLLRENMYFPIAITFTSDDYKVTPDSFDTIIDRCIKDSIAEYNEKNKGVNVEYLLCSSDFQGLESQAELQRELSKYSWWKLRNYRPQAMGLTFTPVFVFDQFEEVFNLPGSIVWTKKFFDWLEDVSSDSCPEEIANKIRKIIGDKAAFPSIKEEKGFKAVFSLRKEFIGELDYWGMQTHFIPALKDNRYCLKALTYEGAKKVMTQQERFEEDKVEQVLTHFVGQYSRESERTIAENLPAIPALLLSVVCDSWEKDIAAFAKLSTDEIDQSLNIILEKFYDETIEAVIKDFTRQNTEAVTPESIRKDIDTAMFDLVDVNGKRVRVKAVTTLGTISMDSGGRFSETLPIVKYKEILNKHRIIKITKIDGEDYVEIVHDCLCLIIAKRREIRLAVEAKDREERLLREQTRKMRKRIYSWLLYAMFFSLGIIILVYFSQERSYNTKLLTNISEQSSYYVEHLLNENDPYSAMVYAISILPADLTHPDRPYTPEAEHSLRASARCDARVLHGYNVYSVAFSPDAERIAFSTYDTKKVVLWDVISKEHNIHELSGHSELILSTAFSHDGSKIVSASIDKTIKIWDTKSLKEIFTINGHTGPVRTAYYSSDDKYILSSSNDSTARLWNAKTHKEIRRFEGHEAIIQSARFNSRNDKIVTSSNDGTVRVWDVKSGRLIQTLIDPSNKKIYYSDACFSPDGENVYASAHDGTIKKWKWETGELNKVYYGHTSGVYSISCTSDGTTLVSSGEKNIIIWNSETGDIIKKLNLHSTTIYGVDISTNDSLIVSGSPDGRVIIWKDLQAIPQEKVVLQFTHGEVMKVKYSIDGNRMACGFEDGTVSILDVNNNTEIKTLCGHMDRVTSIDYAPDGNSIASASIDGSVIIWDNNAGKILHRISGHLSMVTSVCYSPDGTQLASSSFDGTIRLWDMETGLEIRRFGIPGIIPNSVVFHPDGKIIYASYSDGIVRAWNIATGRLCNNIHSDSRFLNGIDLSPDGTRAVLAASNPYRVLWDISSSDFPQWGLVTESILNDVKFSPSGEYIAFVDNRNRLTIRHAESGVEVTTYEGTPTFSATSVSYSPNGRSIAVSSTDGSVKIYDFPPLQELINIVTQIVK